MRRPGCAPGMISRRACADDVCGPNEDTGMITTSETTKTAVLAGRIERDKLLSWLGLVGALAVSAVLNLWNLTQNGYDNLYYSVAVQSMMQSWHNFFFASYDAGGFISVDKPPVALWKIGRASCRERV